jgi:hypothetical protein
MVYNLNGRMPRSTSPCTCTSTSTTAPEPELTPTTEEQLTIVTSAPTQAGGTINIKQEENPMSLFNLAITMTYFDSVYFGSLDFAPPISAPTVCLQLII